MAMLDAGRQTCRRVLPQPAAPHAASGGRAKGNGARTGAPESRTLDVLHVGHLGTVATWPGRVLTAAADRGAYGRPSTDNTTAHGTRQGVHHRHVHHRHVRRLQRADGHGRTITKETTMRVPRPEPSRLRRDSPDRTPIRLGPEGPGLLGGSR